MTYTSVGEVVVRMATMHQRHNMNDRDLVKAFHTPRGTLLLQLVAVVGPVSVLEKKIKLHIQWQPTGWGVLDHGMVDTRANDQWKVAGKLGYR